MPQLNHAADSPPAGLGPLSPSTGTRVCAGAMQNACRRYGDLPPWGAPRPQCCCPESANRHTARYCQALETAYGLWLCPFTGMDLMDLNH
jgi:hypothetical protein